MYPTFEVGIIVTKGLKMISNDISSVNLYQAYYSLVMIMIMKNILYDVFKQITHIQIG